MQSETCPSPTSTPELPLSLAPVFRALADPVRRNLIDRLHARNGQTLRELCIGLAMARQSVTQHLVLLERAGLLRVEWGGREKRHFLNATGIYAVWEHWIVKFAPSP